MQIHEILSARTLTENIDFFKGLGQGIVQRFGVQTPTASPEKTFQAFADPNRLQSEIAKTMKPQIDALSQRLMTLWVPAVTDIMKKTQDKTTGRMGVKTIQAADPAKLQRIVDSQVNKVISQMSQGRLSDYRQLDQVVDPKAYSGAGQRAAQAVEQQLARAIAAVLVMEPTAGRNQMTQAWNQVVAKAFEAALMAVHAGQTVQLGLTKQGVAVNSSGQLTINGQVVSVGGQPLQANSPQAQQIIQTMQQQGRVP